LDVVRRCYPGYQEFRDKIHAYDPERLFQSELSQRLGL
jgi:decaprenylphospho-beta-D-ribofuranose 2-oxidase